MNANGLATRSGPSRPADATADTSIIVRDAHLNNLKHVDVTLPRGKLVAVTGMSGSGKSSLAFGTIHGEAQRRYLESVAPFARRLIAGAVDPKVGNIDGLPPTVALEQSRTSGGARSTVGTFSTLSNSVRLLYSRCGDYAEGVRERNGGRLDSDAFSPNTTVGMCPNCQGTGVVHRPTEETMIPDPSKSIEEGAIEAWPGAWAGKNFHDIVEALGFDMNTPWRDLPEKDRQWLLFTDERPVVDIYPVRGADQVQLSYKGTWKSVANYLTDTLAETESEPLRRRVLSFMEHNVCPVCDGRKLTPDALKVTYAGMPIDELNALPLEELREVLGTLYDTARSRAEEGNESNRDEAERLLLAQLVPTLKTSVDLGIGHLSLDRAASTLSAGELQRLRLASQLSSGLFGVAYVLDEPSAGLHPEERNAVADLMRRFIDAGNSVLLVEHDMNLVRGADWVIDVGPVAGEGGGQILYSGTVDGLIEWGKDPDCPSATARRLAAQPPELNDSPRTPSGTLSIKDINARSIHGLDLSLGLGTFTAVAGVSGSGKSTLVSTALGTALRDITVATKGSAAAKEAAEEDPGAGDEPADAPGAQRESDQVSIGEVTGAEEIDRFIHITQKPIGRTSRSTLATYTGLFDKVRKLFAQTDEARARKWNVTRFSYNMKPGRCPTCNGAGALEVELVFLPGSYTQCPDCKGKRYNDETLEVTWNGYTIADILELTVDEAIDAFADEPGVLHACEALQAVGLGYLRLGQGAPELSGGEAQRIKLATELQRARQTRRSHTLYVFDEPTTGLHPHDVGLLVRELNRLVDTGNTVIAVEHDMTVVAQADRVIEMGPGAGARGGEIVADDTPAGLAAHAQTPTGRVLAALR
ncbi:excinuclease ABC subunit UvrA [Corynebacterium liangguodongii]|uniref:UvrABC system protein A n=1 Tax=Corynebacterium liangguodongii TaxID=2079535 RepID=A0A2S0WFP2_9CORY|nr:excinuclease ABC subunit UvrA [Corynebacterium liangguodongii]AWB84579.1 excinuclease ABC subunit A [Corynebacterium liangguodongii]PWB98836.1 excinuclease ABC subunit UvrA [Corynebacterium liangguodongii]